MVQDEFTVLVEEITNTGRLDTEAQKYGGKLTRIEQRDQAAVFTFQKKGQALNFIYAAKQMGHKARLDTSLFPGVFTPLDALREDARRIRQAMKKPPRLPPWA
jgi:hypothetical protein